MTYVIAFVIMIVAAGALLVFRSAAEAPTVTIAENIQATTETVVETATEKQESDTAGEFSATASYFTPKRTEHDIDVSLTLDGDTIVSAGVLYDGGAAITPAHIGFDDAYKVEVIGQNINEVKLSRVGGASLTSDAFNVAVAEIRTQL